MFLITITILTFWVELHINLLPIEQLLFKVKHSAITCNSNNHHNRETEINAHPNIFNTNDSVNYPLVLGGIFLQHLQLLCLVPQRQPILLLYQLSISISPICKALCSEAKLQTYI